MTFTYTGAYDTNLQKIRFWTGDTTSPGYMSDETINAIYADEGTLGKAVIAGLQYILSQLSRPDFRADWLQVSNAEARKGVQAQLTEMRRKFGVAAVSCSVVHVYRADSDATEEPDYSEGAISVDAE